MTITWGLGATQTHDPARLVDLGRWAEGHGFARFWYGNEKLYPDMMVGLTLVASRTSTVCVGTFIADPYSAHPALTAAAVATLGHVASGRVVLAVGAGGSGLRELGLERRQPARAVEDAVTAMRRLLRGETLDVTGASFRIVDSGLHFPVPKPIPVWVASRGVRVLEAGGRTADGVMIGTFARPRDIAIARGHVWQAARRAGRDPADVTIAVRVDVALAEERDCARDALRSFIAGVLSASYPDRGFVAQANLEVPADLEAVCTTKDLHLAWRSGHLVPDEFVDAFAWAGTPDDVCNRVREVLELGIGEITVMLHPGEGQTLDGQLQLFVDQVMRGFADEPRAPSAAQEGR